jgi:hypothetical protein
VVLAQKPFKLTIARNVLNYATGAMNIDATRVGSDVVVTHNGPSGTLAGGVAGGGSDTSEYRTHVGRHPANVLIDNSDEAFDAFPMVSKKKSAAEHFGVCGWEPDEADDRRFWYGSKASAEEKGTKPGEENVHATVKPLKLMRWLVRLLCPPGGVVFDPFVGTGTTLEASLDEVRFSIGVEITEKYWPKVTERVERGMARRATPIVRP